MPGLWQNPNAVFRSARARSVNPEMASADFSGKEGTSARSESARGCYTPELGPRRRVKTEEGRGGGEVSTCGCPEEKGHVRAGALVCVCGGGGGVGEHRRPMVYVGSRRLGRENFRITGEIR